MTFRVPLPALSANWMRAAIAPALIFIAMASDRQYLADFWHHLARGRAITERGELVDTDLFTCTVAGQSFQDVNWLSQVAYYQLFDAGGLPLVRFVNALALGLMMLVVVRHCRRTAGSWGLAASLGVFTFLGLWQVLTVRPQTFSLLLFVLLYDLLDRAETRPRFLLVAPVVMALWVNLHGAFPAGLLLIGCYFAARFWDGWRDDGRVVLQDRRVLALGLCLTASVLATMVSPYGWKVYQYVATTSGAAAGRRIDEWVPPGLDMLVGKFWVLSLALVLLTFALSRTRPTAREVCLVLCILPLACGSARMVAWWLLAIAPILARLASGLFPVPLVQPRKEEPSAASAAIFGTIVLAMVFSVPGLDQYNPLLGPSRRAAPTTQEDLDAVAECLRARGPSAWIFSRFEWGEYLTWCLGPSYPVFMDGRIEIFPDDVWAAYAAVTSGQADWEEVLDRYRIDYLLVDARYHAGTGLLPQVERSTCWKPIQQSGNVLLYARSLAGAEVE